jgi:hypothetical protein
VLGYKLTDQDGYTRRKQSGETRWVVGETVYPTGEGTKECRPGVLHDYAHPLLAILLNPIHASIPNPRMFEVEHTDASAVRTDQLKRWTTGTLRVLREIPIPEISIVARVRWAILVSLEMPQSKGYRRWAAAWLDGTDRTEWGARAAAAEAAEARAEAAAEAAAWVAEARAAAGAAEAAAWEARAEEAWSEAAVWGARAAARATEWGVKAARAVTATRLIELAERAIHEED